MDKINYTKNRYWCAAACDLFRCQVQRFIVCMYSTFIGSLHCDLISWNCFKMATHINTLTFNTCEHLFFVPCNMLCFLLKKKLLAYTKGTAVAQWLRCCTTNRKVAGSIPDGVIGIFHLHNPSDRTMVLGSTRSPTEMSTRRISLG